MTKPGKTPKKKTKEKSPQRTEESEYPAMDEETYNRLFQNAIEHAKAELQQRHEEQLKAVDTLDMSRYLPLSQANIWVYTASAKSTTV